MYASKQANGLPRVTWDDLVAAWARVRCHRADYNVIWGLWGGSDCGCPLTTLFVAEDPARRVLRLKQDVAEWANDKFGPAYVDGLMSAFDHLPKPESDGEEPEEVLALLEAYADGLLLNERLTATCVVEEGRRTGTYIPQGELLEILKGA